MLALCAHPIFVSSIIAPKFLPTRALSKGFRLPSREISVPRLKTQPSRLRFLQVPIARRPVVMYAVPTRSFSQDTNNCVVMKKTGQLACYMTALGVAGLGLFAWWAYHHHVFPFAEDIDDEDIKREAFRKKATEKAMEASLGRMRAEYAVTSELILTANTVAQYVFQMEEAVRCASELPLCPVINDRLEGDTVDGSRRIKVWKFGRYEVLDRKFTIKRDFPYDIEFQTKDFAFKGTIRDEKFTGEVINLKDSDAKVRTYVDGSCSSVE